MKEKGREEGESTRERERERERWGGGGGGISGGKQTKTGVWIMKIYYEDIDYRSDCSLR